jgi:predicted molibdopterin-dependent oxidoreductase YjgC
MIDRPKTVPIVLFGTCVVVPSGDTLLQVFQHLRSVEVTSAGFCWVTDCHTCEVLVRLSSGDEEWVLACETPVKAGMEITDASQKLKACLRDRSTIRAPGSLG